MRTWWRVVFLGVTGLALAMELLAAVGAQLCALLGVQPPGWPPSDSAVAAVVQAQAEEVRRLRGVLRRVRAALDESRLE